MVNSQNKSYKTEMHSIRTVLPHLLPNAWVGFKRIAFSLEFKAVDDIEGDRLQMPSAAFSAASAPLFKIAKIALRSNFQETFQWSS